MEVLPELPAQAVQTRAALQRSVLNLSAMALHDPRATPRAAGHVEHILWQLYRNIPTVLLTNFGVRAAVHYVGKVVRSNPRTAVVLLGTLLGLSALRLAASRVHSHAYRELATRGFAGRAQVTPRDDRKRAVVQLVQTLAILGAGVAATAMTLARGAISAPLYEEINARLAQQYVVMEGVSPAREMGSGSLHGVHVGNPHGVVPATGRHLEAADITRSMRVRFGMSAIVLMTVAQGVQLQLSDPLREGHGPGLRHSLGIAAAQAVSGWLLSSYEDKQINDAISRKMRRTDPSHVVSTGWKVSPPEWSRLFERVDARTADQVPQMIGIAAGFGAHALPGFEHWSPGAQKTVQAVLTGTIAGALQAVLMRSKIATQQLNDAVRAGDVQAITADPT